MNDLPRENLWRHNHPMQFWKLVLDTDIGIWQRSIEKSISILYGCKKDINPENYLDEILGEYYLGKNRWELGTIKNLYYQIKPFFPKTLVKSYRKWFGNKVGTKLELGWPVEERYVNFLRSVILNVLEEINVDQVEFIHFWPNDYRFAFILTHDIETATGLRNARCIAEIEESYGFRSIFNIVPERYEIDPNLIDWLRRTGFEIGIHGLKHDGKLYKNIKIFKERVKKINDYMESYSSTGFRSPLMHRNPFWLQMLNAQYDMSFFDTDPFEPMPGGTMCIWPYEMGKLIELPYTLAQDYTIFNLLGETTIDKWISKIKFIQENCGMALVNIHPDYMDNSDSISHFEELLIRIRSIGNYWHALPNEVSRWWKKRMYSEVNKMDKEFSRKLLIKDGDKLKIL